MSRSLGVLVALCAVVSPLQGKHGPARTAAPEATLAFEYQRFALPRIVARLSIHGSPWLPFAVDTGTNVPLALDQQVARQILPASGKVPVAARKGNASLIPLRGMVTALTTPAGATPIGVPYGVEANLHPNGLTLPQISGILGLGALRLYTVRIDFKSHKLELYPPGALPHTNGHAAVLPLSEDPRSHRFTTLLQPLAGARLNALVDTGSSLTRVPAAEFAALKGPGVWTRSQQAAVGAAGGRKLLSRIELSGLSEPMVEVSAGTADTPCAIGLDLLSRFRVTFDFRDRLLLLERRADANSMQAPEGYTGIVPVMRFGKCFAATVIPKSPAATAGVQQGDQLIAVDGNLLASVSPAGARRIVNGAAGSMASISIRRIWGQHVMVQFPRLSAYPNTQGGPTAAG
ncbi:MAG: hypothetical protein KGJ62_15275 [Armatimonadetes bacterium]|nr:hypothetical protein [Armatimonadota bacterium]MDE2207533.1 hypothetical protein [Armatimonadota bacterium]